MQQLTCKMVGSCVLRSLHGWGQIWGDPSDNGATHSGNGRGGLKIGFIIIGESLGGSQAPPSFWEVPALPRKFPELPWKFPGDFPDVLSLWNLRLKMRRGG